MILTDSHLDFEWKFYFWMFLMRGQDLEDQEGPGLGNRDGENIEWMSI